MKIKAFYLSAMLVFTMLFLSSCSEDDSPSPSANDVINTIDENPNNGDLIGTVNTNLSGDLNYSLSSESPSGAFAIDQQTGNITVANASLFDFESNPVLTAILTVSNESSLANAIINVSLNDQDDIAFALSTSFSTYSSAQPGEWVSITAEEYEAIAGFLNNVSRSGTAESEFDLNNIVYTIQGGFTVANSTQTSIPASNYVFAFKFVGEAGTNVAGNKFKLSTESTASGFEDYGSPFPEHTSDNGDVYFVLKGADFVTEQESFIAIYMESGNAAGCNSASVGYNYETADTGTLGSSSSGLRFLIQSLSTNQRQWD